MSIFVIGINHHTAAVTLREKVYFSLDKLALYLQDLLSIGHVSEAVLLSTCNRSELYCETDDTHAVHAWFCAQTTARAELAAAVYTYRDETAVAHIMTVACGLDSMVLGEPEVLGQMKQAFSESCAAGAVSALFHRLFQQVFNVAKEIRTTTAIGACPVSVASAAVRFAKTLANDFANSKVVVIGAGDSAELLLRYLLYQVKSITIVNRSVEKAQVLAAEFACHAIGMHELVSALAAADIVFSATGSPVPIVTKEIVAAALPQRTTSLTLIDIAVPRDIDAAVMELSAHTELSPVQLYCIDDLKTMIEKNKQGREHAAQKARAMIMQKSRIFMTELASIDKVAHTIRAYRGQIEAICCAELIKAKQRLHQGAEPAAVLDAFAHAFTRKLLHAPSMQLRQAGAEGRFELLKFAKQLFAIPDAEIERL
jgi:glutamyl-tRNA reductase